MHESSRLSGMNPPVQKRALAGQAGLRDGRSATPRRPPQGLPPAVPRAERASAGGGDVEGCPQAGARSGCARSTGCHASPSVGKIKGRARHQKGTTHPGTGTHGVTRDGTATSGTTRRTTAGVQQSALTRKRSLVQSQYRPPLFTQISPGTAGADLFCVTCMPPDRSGHLYGLL